MARLKAASLERLILGVADIPVVGSDVRLFIRAVSTRSLGAIFFPETP
jgi:hypothetical protein